MTMFQKVSLQKALESDSSTNQYVRKLNRRVRTEMVDELLRRHGK